MAITISNLRFSPYTQKDEFKPIFGSTLDFQFVLPTAHQAGDKYVLGLDYEKVVYPPSRPLCAYTEAFTIDETEAGTVLSMSLKCNTARFRDYVCKIRKPMPITLQLVRLRGSRQETLLLDDILALPSVVDGHNTVVEGDPLAELLDAKLDKPAEAGTVGQVLSLDENGMPIWKDEQEIPEQVQADWDESDSSNVSFIQNKPELATVATTGSYDDLTDKPEIPSAQVQADWNESDSADVSFIKNKPELFSGSYNDLTDKPDLTVYVEKEEGKGLSTNDFTDEDNTKLEGIENGAQVNVQADWDASDSTSERFKQKKPVLATVATSGSYDDLTYKPELATVATTGDYADLTNKPDLSVYVEKVEGKGLSTNDFTDAYKNKLDGIEAGAEVNVQADWDESDSTADSFIQNKPDVIEAPAVAGTVGQVLTKTADGQEWADASKGSEDYFYLTQDSSPFSDTNTIRLNKIVTEYTTPDINLEYSFDKTTWTQYGWTGKTGDEISISTNSNRKVYFRGNNATVSPSLNSFGYYQFVFTGTKIIKAGGNLMSLLDKKCEALSIKTNCFRYLFKDCTLLTIPPSIKAVHFSDGCRGMFQGCTNLQSIVPMQEDADGQFYNMYENCTSLTNVKLSVKNAFLNCFKYMFRNCTSLKTVEVKADVFYSMSGYGMFEGCTALEEAVLGVYKINLSDGYSQLFDRMFFGCTNLKKVRLLNSLFPSNPGDWLKNASEHGVFVCPSNTNIPATRNTSGVPEGWTIAYTDVEAVSGVVISVDDSTDATVELSPSGEVAKHITVSSALTLSASASASTQIAYAEVVLDIDANATVTAGTNLTLVDTLTAGKRNVCVVRWSGGVARLYVTIVEDLDESSSSI